MEPNSAILIVGLTCQPDKEEKFNTWYDRHIADLLRFKGLKKVTRHKTLTQFQPRQGYPDVEYPAYVTIYAFENPESLEAFEASPEFADAVKEARETWAEGGFKPMWWLRLGTLKSWEQ